MQYAIIDPLHRARPLPCAPALQRREERGPVDISQIRPHNVRLSSRPLDWGALHIEQRELEPSSIGFPAGATEHLLAVSLGSGRITRDAAGKLETSALVPGSVALQPANVPMHWSWDTRLTLTLLALEPAFLLRVAAETFGLKPREVELMPAVRKSDPVVATIVATLSREASEAQPGNDVYAQSLAHILAVHLLRQYNRSKPDRAAPAQPIASVPAGRAVQFIQERFAEDIALADIAAAARVSPYHLTRIFKQATGMSPHRYLIQVRVTNARSLLMAGAGRRSVADVAEAVGFSDQSHLTRHMKRLLGVTPGEVRPG
jgi:AraC family transcriptional regulator